MNTLCAAYMEGIIQGGLLLRGRLACIGKRIEIERKGEGAWRIELMPPTARVVRVEPGSLEWDLKLVLSLDDAELDAFFCGALDVAAAVSADKLRCYGDFALLPLLARIFSAPRTGVRVSHESSPAAPRAISGVRMAGPYAKQQTFKKVGGF